jgi:hypothetical protein
MTRIHRARTALPRRSLRIFTFAATVLLAATSIACEKGRHSRSAASDPASTSLEARTGRLSASGPEFDIVLQSAVAATGNFLGADGAPTGGPVVSDVNFEQPSFRALL